MRPKFGYLTSVSLAVLGALGSALPMAAVAQTPDQATAPGAGLEDIIVTASRRAEDVQKESRAISVVGAAELVRQGITDAHAVQDLVPGLTINRNAAQLQVSVRGVGDRTITAATDPSVALNVDGIYYPRSYQAAASFFDLERVEVLKGPQGTLYGRNASSGAINLIPVHPKHELSGFGEIEIGNYGNQRATAAVNVPLGDVVAIRLSGQVVDRSGYLTDGYNDDKNHSLRLQVLIDPGIDTSLLLSASYSHLGGKGDAAVIAKTFGAPASLVDPNNLVTISNHWAGPTDPQTIAQIAKSNPGNETFVGGNGYQDVNVYTLAATFEHRMDWATVWVIPSYVGSRLENLNYAALLVGGRNSSKSNQFALETRLASPDDARIKWVVGAFGAMEDVEDIYESHIPLGGGLGFINIKDTPHRDDRTWAVFGEANASLTDSLRLIAGGRYTWERKVTSGYSYSYDFPFGPPPPACENHNDFPIETTNPCYPTSGFNVDAHRVDKKFNYRAGIEYDVAPQNMVYATVSTGFKAGGFFDGLPNDNTYVPEKLTSYQLGSKNRFFDNRLQINAEAFYWDFKNKQETFLGFIPGIGNVLQTRNAGSVEMYGADVSVAGRITENDTLTGEVEYLHSDYKVYSYTIPLGPGGATSAQPFTRCDVGNNGNGTETFDCSGLDLVRAPKWSGRVAYTRTQPIGEAGTLIFNAQMKFSGSYWLTNEFTPLGRHPSYQTYDAALTWQSANERFSLTGFIKNITDKAVYYGGVQSGALSDAVVGQIGAPRTYGGRFRMTF